MGYIYRNGNIYGTELKSTGQIGELAIAPFVLDKFIVADGTTDYLITNYQNLYDVLSSKCPDLIQAGSDDEHFKIASLTEAYIKLGDTTDGTVEGSNTRKLTACIGAPTGDATRIGYVTDGAASYASSRGVDYSINGSVTSGGGYSHNTPVVEHSVNNRDTNIEPKHVTMIPQFRYEVDNIEVSISQILFDINHPVKSCWPQYTADDDPNVLFNNSSIASEWELVETDGDYIKFDSAADAGTSVNEELPNIKSKMGVIDGIALWGNVIDGACYTGYAQGFNLETGGAGNNVRQQFFDASRGQVKTDGTYVPQADSVYKDGGKVQPKGFTAKLWKRVS